MYFYSDNFKFVKLDLQMLNNFLVKIFFITHVFILQNNMFVK